VSLLDTAAHDSILDRAPANKVQGCIYLMRHGQTALDVEHRSDGHLDFPLSDEGRIGLMAAQQHLKTVPLTHIYTPDLKRTHETAHIVSSGALSAPKIVTTDDARTWNLGVLAGTKKRYGRPEVQKLIDSPGTAPLGGESFTGFQSRFLPWFQKTAAKAVSTGKPVLIVCSGSNLRCLGQVLFGDPDAIDLDEGGLAVLRYAAGRWHEEVLFGAEGASQHVS
jgi:broad specificity phosphatase PhoE